MTSRPQVRDALSKAIYQRLFAFHVEELNKLLQPGAQDGPAASPRGGPAMEPASPRGRKGSVVTNRRGSTAAGDFSGKHGGKIAGSVGLLDV